MGFQLICKKSLILQKKKIIIIEDAAEMIGQKYKNKICGSFGTASTFSFYANKHITTGEGGMIVTNDKTIYERCKFLRNLCFGNKGNRFNHSDIGWNYRFHKYSSRNRIRSITKYKLDSQKKKEIGRRYIERLKNNKNIIIQKRKNKYSDNIFWVFGILIKKNYKLKRDEITKKLLKNNIQTRNFFHPMHKQSILLKRGIF